MFYRRERSFLFFVWSAIFGLCLLSGKFIQAQDQDKDLFKSFHWRSIGPANMGGRISDIQALDEDFRYVIVASASGGVWKSTNAGTTWKPIFDHYGTSSIGAVAIFQKDPQIIWVGTGEANVRNSVIWGDGIYKTMDGGETFHNMGLAGTHHIARIVSHPEDPDVVYVAAQGHLWGYTGDRGLFKTTDGGKTWEKLINGLSDDGRTGCTDIKMDPTDSDVLYAAFWQRIRRPWKFQSGGPNGGIFKSIDGGQSWKKLTRGLPSGDLGRIGIAIYRRNPQILMAIVEHGFQPRRGTPDYEDMSKLGSGVYRSEDGGESWMYINRYNSRPFYYSQIYINPLNDQLVYAMGSRAQVSEDGGKNFEQGMPGIAGDFHVMWLDPQCRDRYYVGNDKGVSLTHDHGDHFNFFDNFAIGQVYEVSVDMRDPYYVHIGLQDNGVWGGPSNSRDYNGILNQHWFKFHSGDGFYTSSDPEDWTTLYSERQNGRLFRNHALYRQLSEEITPSHSNTYNWDQVVPEEKDPQRPVVRRNWNTPFILSPHNPHTLYYGANFLFKSVDRGDHWRIVSPDLSTNDPEKTLRESGGLTRDVTGAETHCTITTISESPLVPGLIWAGTDDGNVQLTMDGGKTWTNTQPNIKGVPSGLWVSRVEASHFDKATCYVAFDGHRSDDFKPYLFKTTDFGKTWIDIGRSIPEGHCIHVVREDHNNRDLLFAGTEFGVFVSIEGGENWILLMGGMPTVSVHDLVIHPRDNDLIAGTHGRSVWILDDISPLQQMTSEIMEVDAHLFESPVATRWEAISRGATRGHQLFIGRNPLSMSQVPPDNSPSRIENSAAINYYLKEKPRNKPILEISTLEETKKLEKELDASPGINRYRWKMRFEPTVSQREKFLQMMEEIFEKLRQQVEKDRSKRLEELYQEFKKAKTTEQWNQVREDLMREFWDLGRGRRFFGSALEGPEALSGVYRLTMRVDGHVLEGFLTIRDDPMLQ
jgi:hypothetical protein